MTQHLAPPGLWGDTDPFAKRVRQRVPPIRAGEPPREVTEWDYYPMITNYVVTVKLKVWLKIKSAPLYMSNCKNNPKTFAAIVLKINDTTCLLFSTGNMVVTGAKTKQGSILAAHRYRLLIEKIPQTVIAVNEKTGERIEKIVTLERYTQFANFRVVNVVGCSTLLDRNINLRDLERSNGKETGWDPEIFPGLLCSIKSNEECPLSVPECTAHVFTTGKGVIMGVKTKKEVNTAHRFLKKMVSRFVEETDTTKATERFFYKLKVLISSNPYISVKPQSKKNSLADVDGLGGLLKATGGKKKTPATRKNNKKKAEAKKKKNCIDEMQIDSDHEDFDKEVTALMKYMKHFAIDVMEEDNDDLLVTEEAFRTF